MDRKTRQRLASALNATRQHLKWVSEFIADHDAHPKTQTNIQGAIAALNEASFWIHQRKNLTARAAAKHLPF